MEVDALLDQLLDLQGQAREACWQSLTVTDPAVRAEVTGFLRAAASVGDFLSQPARRLRLESTVSAAPNVAFIGHKPTVS